MAVQVAVAVVEQQSVAVGRPDRRIAGGQAQGLGCVVLGITAALTAEVDVAERYRCRGAVSLGVGKVVAAQFGLARVHGACRVGDHEVDLLRQPSPDDRVVLVEPECMGLAGHEFLLDQGRNQPCHLLRRRLTPPLIGEGLPQPEDFALADPHGVIASLVGRRRVQPCVGAEQQGTREQEMHQRLA